MEEQEVKHAGAILRLNETGCYYLIEDAQYMSRGDEVLGKASYLDCLLFIPLLGNPSLYELCEAVSQFQKGECSVLPGPNKRRRPGKIGNDWFWHVSTFAIHFSLS
jgi:hypothetical protein